MGLETAALVAIGAGTVGSAYGQYQSGQEEKSLRKKNAAILALQAERERAAAGEQAKEKRLEGQRIIARQNVLYGKGGFQPGGTSLLVRNETVKRIEQQARIVQEHGEFAYSTGMSQAELEKRRGKAAAKAGIWGAGSTLATGLGTVGYFATKD